MRRILAVVGGFVAPAAFATAIFMTSYFDPQPGTLWRWLLAALAVVVAFIAAPALAWRRRSGHRDRASAEVDDAAPETPPAAEDPDEPPETHTTEPLYRRLRRRLRRLRPTDQSGALNIIAGRDAELAEMRELLAQTRVVAGRSQPGRLRRWLSDRPAEAAGAAVLHIHGMPGVGKSVTAQALAALLRSEYPDGSVNVNLSDGPVVRKVSEVHKDLLLQLGYTEKRIPSDPKGRQSLFRSMTNGLRLVVVLDAARDATQVRELLPNGRRCAVLITSRRDLAPEVGGKSYTLKIPDNAAASAILSHVVSAAARPPRPSPVAAAEIIRLCGALPVALRACGAYAVRGGRSLDDIAAELSNPATRLSTLEYDGENPTLMFDGEYDMLISEDERAAFRRLALVDSETFVPWVLRPLLNVDLDEAENLVSRLVEAHLLETADLNIAHGPVRYRFHPLLRLFASTKLSEDERQTYQENLHIAYRGVAREVLRRLDQDVRAPAAVTEPEQLWLPPARVLDRLTNEPDQWARAEHANLVHLVTRTAALDRGLCWRIAHWLGGYMSAGSTPDQVLAALEVGLQTARATRSREGQARVLLAMGSLLLALERYQEAEAILTQVTETADVPSLRHLAAGAWRRRAEGCIQVGAYRTAIGKLHRAEAVARQAGDSAASDRELADLLLRVCHWLASPDEHLEPDTHNMPPAWQDGRRFRVRLLNSDVARREGRWAAAHAELDRAHEEHGGDLRRAAAIGYWRARLLLAEARSTEESDARLATARAAAEGAARTALAFMDMNNLLGEARSHCLLGRALLVAEETEIAAAYYRKVSHFLDKHVPAGQEPPLGFALLRARLGRFRGELLLHRLQGDGANEPSPAYAQDLGDLFDVARTIATLEETAKAFADHGDWTADAETSLVLAQIKLLSGKPVGAVAAAARAVDMFDRGDCIPRQRQAREILRRATVRVPA